MSPITLSPFAVFIRKRRLELNLSVANIARRYKHAPKNIYDYEADHASPQRVHTLELAAALEVEPNVLLKLLHQPLEPEMTVLEGIGPATFGQMRGRAEEAAAIRIIIARHGSVAAFLSGEKQIETAAQAAWRVELARSMRLMADAIEARYHAA